MLLQDQILIKTTPEKIFEFFEHMDENYLDWHPDHKKFRWETSRGLREGVIFYFEERIGGKLMKKTVRISRIIPNAYIEFEPTWWLMRLVMPRLSFEIKQKEENCQFVAKIPIRTGPIGAYLNRREFNAVRQHMAEEGQNLKSMMEENEM